MEHLDDSPITRLQSWLQAAIAVGVTEPGVMILATTDAAGLPDQRAVLLKFCDTEGLVFFADYDSKKARDMETSPNVCVHFYWSRLDRQVRVAGTVQKLKAAQTTRILLGFPDEASGTKAVESVAASSRKFLMQQYHTMKARFYTGGKEASRWGGYRIVPTRFEFWRGSSTGIRERIEYQRDADGNWIVRPLKP